MDSLNVESSWFAAARNSAAAFASSVVTCSPASIITLTAAASCAGTSVRTRASKAFAAAVILMRSSAEILSHADFAMMSAPGSGDHKVKYVYYSILAIYAVWGLIALRLTPNPLVLAVATGVMWNFALGFSSLHTLWVMLTLLPKALHPSWLQCCGLVACAVFYIGISSIAFAQQWPVLRKWVGF